MSNFQYSSLNQIIPDELPNGWISKRLLDLVNSKKGKKPKIIENEPGDGSVPHIDINAFENGVFNRFSDRDSAVIVQKGNLIVVWDGARCGLAGRAPLEGSLGSTLMTLKPNKIDSDYLFWVLRFYFQVINTNPRGIGIPHVDPDIFWNLEIPLPPLNEQHRIVSLVEALLTQVNAAHDQLNRVPLVMKRFRQAVLAAACSGRLTEGWREEHPDVESADILLQKIKSEGFGQAGRVKKNRNDFFKFDQFELPQTWSWTTTSNICTEITDGDHYAPPKTTMGIPFIVISNISTGSINFTKTMYVSKKYYEELADNRKPQYGDILYSVTGSFGIPVLVKTHQEFCFQRHIALLRPNPIIPPEFLWILMKSDIIYQQSKSIATGIAQLTVPLSGLRALKIPLPPLSEQREIVRRVNSLFALADQIEHQVAVATKRTEALTQAVLAKAFRGELVESKSA